MTAFNIETEVGTARTIAAAPRLMSGVSDTELRMQLAKEAQRRWRDVPLRERARRLGRAGDALIERRDALADLICEENGKPRVEALAHDVGGALATLRWLTEQGLDALEPDDVPLRWMPHRRPASVRRSPYGVVLVISPWNFPLSIPFGQVVAGLLAGNAVILKPSEVTPRIGDAVESLFDDCDLPVNLLSVVQGDGQVGAELVDARPDKVFFTGSAATGRKVMAAAAEHPIPVCMELGGVDALIVLDDADLDLASSAAVWGGFMNGGQVCASVERILVQDSVCDAFVGRLVDKARALEPTTDLGPYTADKQRAVYERHIEDARRRRLDVLTGGEFVDDRTFAPTIISGNDVENAQVYREETFGPMLAVRSFRTDAEAIAQHNALWGGLTASIFTADAERAQRVAADLDAGLISVNDFAGTLHAVAELPWGGVGSSGFGRSHGVEGLLEFTWSKVIDTPRAGLGFKRPWWFPYDVDQRGIMDAYLRVLGERDLGRRLTAVSDMGRCALRSLRNAPRL